MRPKNLAICKDGQSTQQLCSSFQVTSKGGDMNFEQTIKQMTDNHLTILKIEKMIAADLADLPPEPEELNSGSPDEISDKPF